MALQFTSQKVKWSQFYLFFKAKFTSKVDKVLYSRYIV